VRGLASSAVDGPTAGIQAVAPTGGSRHTAGRQRGVAGPGVWGARRGGEDDRMSNGERTKQAMDGIVPPVVLIIIAVGLIGGIAVGIQSPLASMISQRLGTLESIFLLHIGGAIASLVPLLVMGGGKLGGWKTLPWYTLTAGIFGVIVIAAISYTIPRVGIAAAITTVVAGQLITSALLDHFGLLGAVIRPLDLPRVAGLGVVMLGVWLTVR